MTPTDQLAAAREAVARVRRERQIPRRHDCGAADDGPDRSPTDPADQLGPACP
jgi:hypothetical protein